MRNNEKFHNACYYKEKIDKCKLKVSDWRATLSLKNGTLSFGEEIRIVRF